MSEVVHIPMPTAGLFVKKGGQALVTTRTESYTGPTPVPHKLVESGLVAQWGPGNNHPQRVIADKRSTSLMAAVIERKVSLLISGGLRYGKVVINEYTGEERMIPMRVPEIHRWLQDTNIKLYLREAANDWYTYYNVFAEYRFNRGYDRVLGLGCQDASHVRLGVMNDKAEITKAYLADWGNSATEGEAIELPALDPYFRVADQLRNLKQPRAILPIRHLNDGQFYYGIAPWDGLRANGWLDVSKRVPMLKKLLLEGLMHIRYHIEIDERYWQIKYPDWANKKAEDRIALMKKEVEDLEEWLTGTGQGGAYLSTMKAAVSGNDQTSLVKIHDKKLTIPEGAYIEDSQEADFIMCRDMGLKPSMIGISPSKSGSSPGSGSEDRVSRTNHVLDSKPDQDMILEPLNHVRDVNGWDPEIEFWFSNYYAATLDRTMQVDRKANAGPER